MLDTPRSFADVLRLAIDSRGLSLERIADHLSERGISVSVATLSYWQSGRSEPGRRSSLAALPHLEDVLGLDPGALSAALPPTRERARRTAVRGLDVLWPEEPHTAVLARLDTRHDADLDRVSVHDVLRLGPDGGQVSLTVRQVLRARTDGPDRRVVMHGQRDASAGLPRLYARRGCTVGRVVRHAVGGVIGAELVFHKPLRRGETVVMEYALASPSPGPRDVEYARRLRLPMREYVLEVEFDRRALPVSVVAFTEDREQAITLDADRRAHLVHTDSAPGTTGIRWTWPGSEEAEVNC